MTSKKVYINLANKYDRVILLIDMDCFYCQVEEKLNPSLAGKPIAVVQYNTWQGGGIIAVNYVAREQGVTRHMRGEEAKEHCPDIELVRVPSVREKADLTKYREAGKKVAMVLQSFTPILERASIDEAYLDITENVLKRFGDMNKGLFKLEPDELNNTYAIGYENIGDYIKEIFTKTDIDEDDDDFDYDENDTLAVQGSDLKLLIGASIANEIRAKVKEKTGYECSAGIAHNKIIAKLACGVNKPNKQTVLPLRQIRYFFNTLPLRKIKGLGGKFGEEVCEILDIKFFGDLRKFSEKELQKKFDEKSGTWLYLIARGIDLEAVTQRFYSKSIGCCKKFPGKNSLNGINSLNHWLLELSKEICDRMEKDIAENNRKAKQMVVSYIQEINGNDVSSSRSTNMMSYEPEIMSKIALDLIRKNTDQFLKSNNENVLHNPIKFLGISVGKFESIETKQNTIEQLFINHSKKKASETTATTSCNGAEAEEHSKMSSKENDDTKSEKTVVKSFFAAHLKKQHNEEKEENRNEKEVKSFFLNAIKANNKKLTEEKLNETNSSHSIEENFEQTDVQQNIQNCSKNIQNKNESDVSHNSIPGTSKQNYENVNHNASCSNSVDYTKNYVEFAIPEPKDNDYINCEKCNKKILSYTLQTHMDFHYAFEISREQRETFRKEIKSKIILSPPPTKKLKTSSTANNKSSSNNNSSGNSNSCSAVKNNNKTNKAEQNLIEKFLVKSNENTMKNFVNYHDDNSDDVEPKELCKECGKQISIEKMIEHLDYHVAKKLQAEINRTLMQQEQQQQQQKAQSICQSSSTSSSLSPDVLLDTETNKKKSITKDIPKDDINKNKTITTYFTPHTLQSKAITK